MKYTFILITVLWFSPVGRTQTDAPTSNYRRITPFGQVLREHGYTTTHESLVAALHSSVSAVRSDAAAVLAGKKDVESTRLIEDAISSERDEYTAVLMAGVLMSLKSDVGRSVLVHSCADPSSSSKVRDRSTFELSLRGEGSQCTDALLRSIDTNPAVCSTDCIPNLARLYVASTSQQRERMIKVLKNRFQSPSMEDRAAVARALKQIDTAEAENAIQIAYVTESDPTVRVVMQQNLELFQSERPASQR